MGRNTKNQQSLFDLVQGIRGREENGTPNASHVENGSITPGRLGPWQLNTVHNVDCLAGLKRLPSDSLDVAITSPPYWGQRGAKGIGSEEDPREYVRNLVAILAEAMRCLKPSGTFWLNIGDAYNTPINWRKTTTPTVRSAKRARGCRRPTRPTPKNGGDAGRSSTNEQRGYSTATFSLSRTASSSRCVISVSCSGEK